MFVVDGNITVRSDNGDITLDMSGKYRNEQDMLKELTKKLWNGFAPIKNEKRILCIADTLCISHDTVRRRIKK